MDVISLFGRIFFLTPPRKYPVSRYISLICESHIALSRCPDMTYSAVCFDEAPIPYCLNHTVYSGRSIFLSHISIFCTSRICMRCCHSRIILIWDRMVFREFSELGRCLYRCGMLWRNAGNQCGRWVWIRPVTCEPE